MHELEHDLSHFKQQLIHYPENSDINYNIAQIYQLMNKLDLAVKFFERSLKLSPDDTEALTRLSMIYWKIGSISHARDLLLKAHKILPSDNQLNYGLGIIYSDLADYEKANFHFWSAFAAATEEEARFDILYHIGLVNLNSGNIEACRQIIDKLSGSVHQENLKKLIAFSESDLN